MGHALLLFFLTETVTDSIRDVNGAGWGGFSLTRSTLLGNPPQMGHVFHPNFKIKIHFQPLIFF